MCLSLQLTAAQNEKCDSSKQDCDAAEIVVPVKKEAMTPASLLTHGALFTRSDAPLLNFVLLA